MSAASSDGITLQPKHNAKHENEVMSLNGRDSETFLNALLKPLRFNKKMVAALKEHDQRVTLAKHY